MHVVLEKARKSAGISGMSKNYPDSPKQRGCGYWAAFIGSLSNDLGQMDAAEKKLLAEIKDLARDKAELEHQLNEALKNTARNGVEAIGHAQGWSVEQRKDAVQKIVG